MLVDVLAHHKIDEKPPTVKRPLFVIFAPHAGEDRLRQGRAPRAEERIPLHAGPSHLNPNNKMENTKEQQDIKEIAEWLEWREPFRSGTGNARDVAEHTYTMATERPVQASLLFIERAQAANELRRRMHAISAISSDGTGTFEKPISLSKAEYILGPLEIHANEVGEAFTLLKQVLSTPPLCPAAHDKLIQQVKALVDRVEGETK